MPCGRLFCPGTADRTERRWDCGDLGGTISFRAPGWGRAGVLIACAAWAHASTRAVRRDAPGAKLVVDTSRAGRVDDLTRHPDTLATLGVALPEQPAQVGEAAGLDEAQARFQVVNTRLGEAGGLTAAMELAEAG